MTEVGGRLRTAGAHRRRGDDRAPVDRRRPVHLHVPHRHLPRAAHGFRGAMAIAVMMLPIIARAADVVAAGRPRRLAGGRPRARLDPMAAVWHVILPTARPGLATALILGIARGVGETSPVLLTSGSSTFINVDPFHNPMNVAAAVHLLRGAQRRTDVHHSWLRGGCRAADHRSPAFRRARRLARTEAAGSTDDTTPSTFGSSRRRSCGGRGRHRSSRSSSAGRRAARPTRTRRSKAPGRRGARTRSTSGSPTCSRRAAGRLHRRPVRPKAARTSRYRTWTSP